MLGHHINLKDSVLLKIPFKIKNPYKLRSSKWPLFFRIWNYIYINIHISCHMYHTYLTNDIGLVETIYFQDNNLCFIIRYTCSTDWYTHYLYVQCCTLLATSLNYITCPCKAAAELAQKTGRVCQMDGHFP